MEREPAIDRALPFLPAARRRARGVPRCDRAERLSRRAELDRRDALDCPMAPSDGTVRRSLLDQDATKAKGSETILMLMLSRIVDASSGERRRPERWHERCSGRQPDPRQLARR